MFAYVVSSPNIPMHRIYYFSSRRTTEGLDMKLKGKYVVTVTATDTGGLSTNTELEVRNLNGALQPDEISANTHTFLSFADFYS